MQRGYNLLPKHFDGCPSILISPALSFKQSKPHSTFETVVWHVKNSSIVKEQRSRAHRKKISFVLAFKACEQAFRLGEEG